MSNVKIPTVPLEFHEPTPESETGNRMIMDAKAGKEKIEIQDQYGNKVVLNAAEKRIELKSPTHQTKLELGNTSKGENIGVYVYSDAEYYLDVKSKYFKMVEGAYTTIVCGLYTSVALIGKIDICVGAKLDIFVGAKCVVEAGVKLQVGKLHTKYIFAEDKIETCLKKIEGLAQEHTLSTLRTKMEAIESLKLTTPSLDCTFGCLKVKLL